MIDPKNLDEQIIDVNEEELKEATTTPEETTPEQNDQILKVQLVSGNTISINVVDFSKTFSQETVNDIINNFNAFNNKIHNCFSNDEFDFETENNEIDTYFKSYNIPETEFEHNKIELTEREKYIAKCIDGLSITMATLRLSEYLLTTQSFSTVIENCKNSLTRSIAYLSSGNINDLVFNIKTDEKPEFESEKNIPDDEFESESLDDQSDDMDEVEEVEEEVEDMLFQFEKYESKKDGEKYFVKKLNFDLVYGLELSSIQTTIEEGQIKKTVFVVAENFMDALKNVDAIFFNGIMEWATSLEESLEDDDEG